MRRMLLFILLVGLTTTLVGCGSSSTTAPAPSAPSGSNLNPKNLDVN
jgi:hypothetical protein